MNSNSQYTPARAGLRNTPARASLRNMPARQARLGATPNSTRPSRQAATPDSTRSRRVGNTPATIRSLPPVQETPMPARAGTRRPRSNNGDNSDSDFEERPARRQRVGFLETRRDQPPASTQNEQETQLRQRNQDLWRHWSEDKEDHRTGKVFNNQR